MWEGAGNGEALKGGGPKRGRQPTRRGVKDNRERVKSWGLRGKKWTG